MHGVERSLVAGWRSVADLEEMDPFVLKGRSARRFSACVLHLSQSAACLTTRARRGRFFRLHFEGV